MHVWCVRAFVGRNEGRGADRRRDGSRGFHDCRPRSESCAPGASRPRSRTSTSSAIIGAGAQRPKKATSLCQLQPSRFVMGQLSRNGPWLRGCLRRFGTAGGTDAAPARSRGTATAGTGQAGFQSECKACRCCVCAVCGRGPFLRLQVDLFCAEDAPFEFRRFALGSWYNRVPPHITGKECCVTPLTRAELP